MVYQEARPDWMRMPVGINDTDRRVPWYVKREWDLGSERWVGAPLELLVRSILRESRFNLSMFKTPGWIGHYQGRIMRANFKLFEPNPHESTGAQRSTGSGKRDYWVPVELDLKGEIVGYDPMRDTDGHNDGLAVGIGSRVGLDNLTNPGSDGGWGHIPLMDITKPPTPENVLHLIKEVRRRCRLDKFFVVRSSEHGMMVVAPEIVDEENLLNMWNSAELINHVESGRDDFWFDSRWRARSCQNHKESLGLPNAYQVCGILRLNAMPPLKPSEPTVIAASF